MGKLKLAILTNILSPIELPVFQRLSDHFELLVVLSGIEANRNTWYELESRFVGAGIKLRKAWGTTLSRTIRDAEGVLDRRFMHINPGYWSELVRFRPDAVITTQMGFRTLVALLYGAAYRKPVWIWWGGTVHTERSIDPMRKVVRRVISRLAKRWLSYGQTSTEYLQSLGVPRAYILELQHWVDEGTFKNRVPPLLDLEPRPVLLFVGQMIRRKGVHLLLEAAARLQKTGYRFSLLLVGDGPERNAFCEYAGNLGLRNAHFYPAQLPERMPAVYRSGDVLVFPTLEDVWGLVVNEALWSGLPVISSIYAGCTSEIVPPQNWFDPLQADDFDRALRFAIEGRIAPPDLSRLRTSSEIAESLVSHLMSVLGTREKCFSDA
ncbi:MAG: glycosyltransferase family 4 protein [Candidatus Methanomethyliaceae archaeon]